jgi:hypothetical protein
VRRSSRCQEGRMVGNSSLWADVDGLTPLKARISLMLALLAESAD